MDLEQEAGKGVSQEWHPDQLEYTQSAFPLSCQPGPSSYTHQHQLLLSSRTSLPSSRMSTPAPQGPPSFFHCKTRSTSRALSQLATPLAIAHNKLKLAAERLREAEDKVCKLEEENE
ncbi:hypothetical protein PAXRUDRAFT_803796 [Paxillus rubicundulus Ve08.2h10]|uniref:Uncharacterized protein n=1 Tax=Paxillus rubicundulus Ve08.2h10 TaxID=930991 RepID=A0A0D0DMI7_9AGAM|nr:hypothetical protein PAXRUDRAFT_803796 [Paxillus rubicundulus Ve08.2h10]